MWRKQDFGRRRAVTSVGEGLVGLLEAMDGNLAARLIPVWRGWPAVVGEELAELARPMGHKGTTLYLAALSGADLNELAFRWPEVVHAVNAFLGQECFDNAHIDLLQGRTSLDAARVGQGAISRQPPAIPDNVGNVRDALAARGDLGKRFARLYEKYVGLKRDVERDHE